MTLDISLEAIEADLIRAEGASMTSAAHLHLARAQVRATLLAAQPADHQGRHEAPAEDPRPTSADVLIQLGPGGLQVVHVPGGASWNDRVEAAASILNIDPPLLALRLGRDKTSEELVIEPPAEPDLELDLPEGDEVDADFFADVKAQRKRGK